MKRRQKIVLLGTVAILSVAALTQANPHFRHYGLSDWTAWLLNDHAETIYAAGFSEGQFAQLRKGMTPREVESLLGPPLRKMSESGPEGETWDYSLSTSATWNYHMRMVVFSRDQKVDLIAREYYIDGDEH